jgi:hypothetical protein
MPLGLSTHILLVNLDTLKIIYIFFIIVKVVTYRDAKGLLFYIMRVKDIHT